MNISFINSKCAPLTVLNSTTKHIVGGVAATSLLLIIGGALASLYPGSVAAGFFSVGGAFLGLDICYSVLLIKNELKKTRSSDAAITEAILPAEEVSPLLNPEIKEEKAPSPSESESEEDEIPPSESSESPFQPEPEGIPALTPINETALAWALYWRNSTDLAYYAKLMLANWSISIKYTSPKQTWTSQELADCLGISSTTLLLAATYYGYSPENGYYSALYVSSMVEKIRKLCE